MEHIKNLVNTCTLLVVVIALHGCAAIEKRDAMDTERMLSAAGFKMKFADTPQKLANLKTLTQSKLVPHDKDGKVFYVYADAEFCKCLYVGSEKSYQQYQKMRVERNIAQMNEDAAMDNENAAMNWGMWGPWGPWGPWY